VLPQAVAESYNELVVLAVIVVLLVNVFFLFKVVPWSRPGSWRRIWVLATIASILFIVSEAVILTDPTVWAIDTAHQFPLFGALLAGATGFYLVYTDAYRAAERARILSLTDALTELPNRRAFEERLKLAYERGERFALLYFDLDGFKSLNDKYGHAAGDDALREVGAILRQAVRQADMASRFGGDEFCLLLASASAVSTRVVAERILAGMRSMPLPPGASISASFGIATDRDGTDPASALAAADAAMYRAKRAQVSPRIAYAPTLEAAEARTSA
jgi:diguanylate cyclase (GGDEF)-like protein